MKYHYKLGTPVNWDLQLILEDLKQPNNAGYRYYGFTQSGDKGFTPIYESVSAIPSYSFAGVEDIEHLWLNEFGAKGYTPGSILFDFGVGLTRLLTIMSKPTMLATTYQYTGIEKNLDFKQLPDDFVEKINILGAEGFCQATLLFSSLYFSFNISLRRDMPIRDKCEYEAVPAESDFRDELDQLKSQGARGYHPAFFAYFKNSQKKIYVRNLRRNAVIGYYERSLKLPDGIYGIELAQFIIDDANREGAKGAVAVRSVEILKGQASDFHEIKTIYRVAAECDDSSCESFQAGLMFP